MTPGEQQPVRVASGSAMDHEILALAETPIAGDALVERLGCSTVELRARLTLLVARGELDLDWTGRFVTAQEKPPRWQVSARTVEDHKS